VTLKIGNRVKSIGEDAFYFCDRLSFVAIPDSVTCIEDYTFGSCLALTNVTFGNALKRIGWAAFLGCENLTSVTVPASVEYIEDWAFGCCTHLTGIYFKGNAPMIEPGVFYLDTNTTVYYLPGTEGWDMTLDRPTAPWYQPGPVILTLPPRFGIQADQFAFRVSWATNAAVVVEACNNLTVPSWSPVFTNALSNGWFDFSDSNWVDDSPRFYRLRLP
jgi:hypothetical protein